MLDVSHNERVFIADNSKHLVPKLGQSYDGALAISKVVGIERHLDKYQGSGYMVYLEYIDINFVVDGTLD